MGRGVGGVEQKRIPGMGPERGCCLPHCRQEKPLTPEHSHVATVSPHCVCEVASVGKGGTCVMVCSLRCWDRGWGGRRKLRQACLLRRFVCSTYCLHEPDGLSGSQVQWLLLRMRAPNCWESGFTAVWVRPWMTSGIERTQTGTVTAIVIICFTHLCPPPSPVFKKSKNWHFL